MTALTAPTYGNLVNGAFVDTAATFEDANPADPDDVVARFPASSADDVDAAAAGYVDIEELKSRPPMKGLAQVSDIVAGIHYLASDEARFVTGQTLAIDGGWTWAGP